MASDILLDRAPSIQDAEPLRVAPRFQAPMKSDLVEKAREKISHPPLLINMISKRVRQLNMGRAPLVERRSGMGLADVALTEIIEGKIIISDAGEVEETTGA